MIISVDNAKQIVSTDLTDKQFEQKLETIELLIRKFTNNNFQIREIRSQSEAVNGKLTNLHQFMQVGDTVEISQSKYNNGIYVITAITDEGAVVSGRLYDCEENLVTKVFYPADVVYGCLDMLKWQIDNADKTGIQSERLSRYSITYSDRNEDSIMSAYPKALTGFLKPYMKARF